MKIDKNIPLPPRRGAHRSKAIAFIDTMQAGDSVLFNDVLDANRLRDALRYRGIKTSIRKGDDGVRVWRLS